MTISEEILSIANQLANEGKKPSVALIKQRLSQPVPLPNIVSVLKNWTHQPDRIQSPDSQIQNKVCTTVGVSDEIQQAINEAIKPLKTQIASLEQEVGRLKSKLINNP